jgi:cobyrinic acid a,c-diamide synthase
MLFPQPRITIGALKGGSGKTILSLGLIAAWRGKGRQIAPFKKGPDFIDASWLTFAAARPCYNLDPFMMNNEQIVQSFVSHSGDADLSLIEGNRGVFDGLDLEGRCSTAELAKLLKTPVILIVDVTMVTRTVAAVIKGCQAFDPNLNVAGVILNRVAGSRQEALITNAIETYCDTIVVGSVPKLQDTVFPERHMGLVPYQEREHAEKAISWTRETMEKYLQLDAIWGIANEAKDIEINFQSQASRSKVKTDTDSPQIGVVRDKAFWFYYPENLEQLERMGARLVEIDAISQQGLPPLDALYIGGGFPEIQAQALSDNRAFRNALREEIEKGLPVYAECGGFMYLGKSLVVDGKTYPMVGAIPLAFVLKKRPQGHGYTVLEVSEANPYYRLGEILKGHEFHYSKPVFTGGDNMDFVFKVCRGHGVDGEREGLCKKNVLATFTHIHAAGNPKWAKGLFKVASEHRRSDGRKNG